MDLNLDKFRHLLEEHAVPIWKSENKDWDLRTGGGENYIQEKVLKKAHPFLMKGNLKVDVKKNLMKILGVHVNLLSSFEWSHAKLFIENSDETELKENILNLLYSDQPLKKRIANFLQSTQVIPIGDGNKKAGINATVCSYFLAMSNPKLYPYFKLKTFPSL